MTSGLISTKNVSDLPHGVSSIEHKDYILVRLQIRVSMNQFLYLFHLLFSPILFVLHQPIWISSITMWFGFCNLGKFWLSFHVWDFVRRGRLIPHWDEWLRSRLHRLNFLDCSDRTCLANGETLTNIADILLQHLDSKWNLNEKYYDYVIRKLEGFNNGILWTFKTSKWN